MHQIDDQWTVTGDSLPPDVKTHSNESEFGVDSIKFGKAIFAIERLNNAKCGRKPIGT